MKPVESYFTRELSILYAALAVTRVGFGSIIVVFPRYVEASQLAVGVILALYPLLEGVSAVPIGEYVDRRGRKLVFLAGMLSMTALTASIGLTRNTYFISAAHALMGLSAAAIIVSSLTMITDLTRKSNRGVGMGIFDFSNIAGYAMGILLGSSLYEFYFSTPGYVFFITAVFLAVAAVISLILVSEPPHEPSGKRLPRNPIKGLDPKTTASLPMWFSMTLLLGIVFFLPKALGEEGLTTGESGRLLFVGTLGLGLGGTAFGRLSDKIGRGMTAVIGVTGVVGLLPSLAISFPNVFDYWFLVGPFGLMASALVPSVLALVGDTARRDMRGSAMGLYSMMLGLGIALGNVIGGIASSLGGVRGILYTGGAIFLVLLLVTALLLYRAGFRLSRRS